MSGGPLDNEPARIHVPAAELQEKWMSTESSGMIHDHHNKQVGVLMNDGTVYYCTFAEKKAHAKEEAAK